jgi:hypothetical protein
MIIGIFIAVHVQAATQEDWICKYSGYQQTQGRPNQFFNPGCGSYTADKEEAELSALETCQLKNTIGCKVVVCYQGEDNWCND